MLSDKYSVINNKTAVKHGLAHRGIKTAVGAVTLAAALLSICIPFSSRPVSISSEPEIKLASGGSYVLRDEAVLTEDVAPVEEVLELTIGSEEDADAAILAIQAVPDLKTVVVKAPEGSEHVDFTALARVMSSARKVRFEYSFTLYGLEVDLNATELYYDNVRIGNDGVQIFYELLPCMRKLDRLVLDDCQVDNEVMAELRDAFPYTTIAWRVYWDTGWNTLTDTLMLRASGTATNNKIDNLKYCNKVRFIDMGHSPQLTNLEFTRYMPHLQILIIVDSSVSSLEPLAECEELIMLEIVNCQNLTDFSPLANCKKLRLLNFSTDFGVKDISPLYDLPELDRVFARLSSIPNEQFDKLQELHPDCWVHHGPTAESYVSGNYSIGWRLDAAPLVTAAWYDEMHLCFGIGKEIYTDDGYFSTKRCRPYTVPVDELDYFADRNHFDCP